MRSPFFQQVVSHQWTINGGSECPIMNSSLDIQTGADMTTILSQNIGHQSTSNIAPYPGRKDISLV
jgi:hypothetical protein